MARLFIENPPGIIPGLQQAAKAATAPGRGCKPGSDGALTGGSSKAAKRRPRVGRGQAGVGVGRTLVGMERSGEAASAGSRGRKPTDRVSPTPSREGGDSR